MPRRFKLFNKSIAGLAWSFQVNPDSCDNPAHYELYLRTSAVTDQMEGRGLTFIFAEEDDREIKEILGFVTLRASSMIRQYGEQTRGDAALEITELAVSKDHEREGIGTKMLEFAIVKAAEINENMASIRYVLVCADPKAVPFYEKYGFAFLHDYGDIPREGWNDDCIPMFLQLPSP